MVTRSFTQGLAWLHARVGRQIPIKQFRELGGVLIQQERYEGPQEMPGGEALGPPDLAPATIPASRQHS